MLIKKNTMLKMVKQNPIEYMSFFGNRIIFSKESFKKYLGSIADPMKNATNAIINVITKLLEGAVIDKSKNIANKNSTIKGLKIWFFKMLFLFKKLKKVSLGYNFLK